MSALCSGAAADRAAQPFALAGALDLSGWRFERDGAVSLIGDWALYPGVLLPPQDIGGEGSAPQPVFAPVPGGWRQMSESGAGVSLGRRGAATYTLTIKLPRRRDGLGLQLPPLAGAARIFVDGRELARQGRPALAAGSERIDPRPAVVPLPRTSGDEVDLVIQLSNFSLGQGGIMRPLQVGPINELFAALEGQRRYGLLVTSAALAFAVYYGLLYVFRRDDRENGFFALLLAAVGIHAAVSSGLLASILPNIDFVWLLKIDHAVLYALPWIVYAWLYVVFPREASTVVYQVGGALALGGAAMVAMTPPQVFTLLIPLIAAQAVFCGSAALIALWQAVRLDRPGARLALGSIVLAGFAAFYAAMVNAGELPPAPDFTPLALLSLLAVQAAAFDSRMATLQTAFGTLSSELEQTNARLEREVAERTESLNDTVQALRSQVRELADANAALERESAEKDRFFTIIAHDLRTPFNALMGFADLMEQRAADLEPDYVRYYASEIQRAGRSVLALLDNLLQWARVQMGQMRFNPQPRDLAQIVDAALEAVGPMAAAKPVSISNDVRSQLVYVDFDMLVIVIRNLLSNAVKFSESGSTVWITAKSEEDHALLRVIDEGIGMSEDTLSRLFSADGAIIRAGTDGEQGTGLGLLLCRDLIEKHGGTLSVDSRQGRGTTVSVTLPARARDARTGAGSSQRGSGRADRAP